MEKVVIEVGIYGIVSDLHALHGCAIQFVPLNSNGKPIFLRNYDPIFLHLFPIDVVKGVEEKRDFSPLFAQFTILLLYFLKTLKNKIDEIAHVCLIKPLP